jgi:signal transduction histidine kinase
MKSESSSVSELAFIFKLLPLFHEVDSVDRLFRLLLAIVTSGKVVGYRRAVLLVPDPDAGTIRGRYGVERAASGQSGTPRAAAPESGFAEMARSVFENYERADASDLTVMARAYAVPMGWHRSAIVKALRTTYPVLAERGLSEFATDTFFDFFGVSSYIAVPVEIDRRVAAVIAVDRTERGAGGSAEEISVLYSVVQQAGAAAHRLLEGAADRRKARILLKLQESLQNATTSSEMTESLRAALSMICRAIEASACVVSDARSRRSIRVESPHRTGETAPEAEIRGIEDLLARVAGALAPAGGNGSDPRLAEDARDHVAHFLAFPIVSGGEAVGAIAAYTVKSDERARLDGFREGDNVFLELCAAVIASAVRVRRANERIRRLENVAEEIGSHLVREREKSRIGDKSIEFHQHVDESLNRIEEILGGESPADNLEGVQSVVASMREHSATHWDDVISDTTSYAMTDLFDLVGRAVEGRRDEAEKRGVEIATRIPQKGVELLLDRESVSDAIDRILEATLSSLGAGEKMLVECSTGDGRVTVCIADTGPGLPGDAVSRLFMPFVAIAERGEGKRALSLAGNVLRRHSASITVRSSRSWRTILALTFPAAAGRDRRKRKPDRRKRGERRVATSSA